MLPPLGPLSLGSSVGQSVPSTAVDETVSSQFADRLLTQAQATSEPITTDRDLDHTASSHQSMDSAFQEIDPASVSLPLSPDSMDRDRAMAPENYALMVVNPMVTPDPELPVGLPLGGNRLPLANNTLGAEVSVGMLQDNSLPQGSTLGLEAAHISDVDLSVRPSPTPNPLSHSMPLGVDDPLHGPITESSPSLPPGPLSGTGELGLSVPRLEVARAHQDSAPQAPLVASLFGPSVGPVVEVPSLGAQIADRLLGLQPSQPESTALPTPVLAESMSPGPLKPSAASLSGLPSSPLLGGAGTAELQPPQGMGGTSLQDRINRAAINPQQIASVTSAYGQRASELAAVVSAAASAVTSTSTSASINNTPLTALDMEASGKSSFTAAPMLADRLNQAYRQGINQSGLTRPQAGLMSPAGNRLEAAAPASPVVTGSTLLQSTLTTLEQRPSSAAVDPRLMEPSSTVAAVSEDIDAANLPASAGAGVRGLSPSPATPSGIIPLTANGRLDVSDGTGGQWVGRLSQMIAQQQLTGQSLRIALSPAELGSMELTFNNGGADNWSVSLSAQQGQTRDLLESHLDRIRAMLQDLGVRDAQVSMSERWSGQQGGANPQPQAQHASAQEQSPDRSQGWQQSSAVEQVAADAPALRDPDAASGVDAYV